MKVGAPVPSTVGPTAVPAPVPASILMSVFAKGSVPNKSPEELMASPGTALNPVAPTTVAVPVAGLIVSSEAGLVPRWPVEA